MLSIPEIEAHLTEMRQELQAQGVALRETRDNLEQLRNQLQVAALPRDAKPGTVNESLPAVRLGSDRRGTY